MKQGRRLRIEIPAKAGIYLSAVVASEPWVPACAGTYSGAVHA